MNIEGILLKSGGPPITGARLAHVLSLFFSTVVRIPPGPDLVLLQPSPQHPLPRSHAESLRLRRRISTAFNIISSPPIK